MEEGASALMCPWGPLEERQRLERPQEEEAVLGTGRQWLRGASYYRLLLAGLPCIRGQLGGLSRFMSQRVIKDAGGCKDKVRCGAPVQLAQKLSEPCGQAE